MPVPSTNGRPSGGGPLPERLGRGVSGRAFVTAAVVGLLVIWGLLYLAFTSWREGARERIAAGKEAVAVIEGLAAVEPQGVDPGEWAEAVEATHAMLVEVVGTGRLDRPALDRLGDDLAERVAKAAADPDRAVTVLGGIWDDMARLARLRDENERPSLVAP